MNSVLLRLGWSAWDRNQARREGWRLDAYWGSRSSGKISVMRHARPPNDVSRFRDRAEAEAHVYARAQEGSAFHQRAVSIIVKARLLK